MTDLIVIPQGAHSVLGPSSAERWLNCAGGVGGVQSEYAAEGSSAHWLSEQVRIGQRPASDWKGKILKSGEFEFKVGKSLVDSVTTFVESVVKLPGVPMIEEMIHYDALVPGGFGTLDDARLSDGQAIITDFKHGKGVEVSARENSQLKLYALGIFFAYDWIFKFKKFVNRISQPRRGVKAEVEQEEISVGHLLQWGYDVVRPRAELLLAGKLVGQLKAGAWCKFCGKKDSCSVRAAYKVQYDRSPDSPAEAFINLEDLTT